MIKYPQECAVPGYPDVTDLDFRRWEDRQSIGNGFGIDLDGFSARKVESESILKVQSESILKGQSSSIESLLRLPVPLGCSPSTAGKV